MIFVMWLAAKIFSYYKASLHLQKETQGSDFCWRRGLFQEDKQERRLYVDYGATADIPQSSVKQYGDSTALRQVKQIILILM